MALMNTVRAPIDTARLGVTLMHEHVFVLSTEVMQNFPEPWGDEEKRVADAIAMFKMNVEFYPNAWNTYDSLGEAYMVDGEKDLAIANYKKSLALNPGNGNGAAMLKKLQAP